jgi:hypothetical protein
MDNCICTENRIYGNDDGNESNEISKTAKRWYGFIPTRHDDIVYILKSSTSIVCKALLASFDRLHQKQSVFWPSSPYLWLLQELWTQAVSWYAIPAGFCLRPV